MGWIDRLDAIERNCREEGWDSYGGAPVTPEAVAAAKTVCRSLDVVPTVHGGIEVVLLSESFQVTIDSSGRVTGFFLDSDDANETLAKHPSSAPGGQ